MSTPASTLGVPRPVAGLWLLIAALVALHLVRPTGSLGDTTYLIGVFSAPVVGWLGVARAARGARLAPALFSAGLTASALGDLVWECYVWLGHEPNVSLADIPYVASYLGLGAGIFVVTLVRRGQRSVLDVEGILDALTVVTLAVLVIWSVSLKDIVGDPGVSAATRLVWAVYPIADAVLLALVLRAMTSRQARAALGLTFAAGVGCWLASDLGYLVLDVEGTVSALLDSGWMVGGALMATATWRQPAPLEPAPDGDADTAGGHVGRLVIAMLPLLAAPVILLVTDHDSGVLEAVAGMAALAVIAFVRTARLLASERRARVELAAARDIAIEASQAKSTFLATMSHEIRTPMNGVLGLTDLLLMTSLDERQRQYAEGVSTAGRSLLTIINDILDFSRVEAGRLELECIDFDPVRLVEDVAELMADPAQAKDLELLAYSSPEVPPGLRGDPGRLRQVLVNLAGNAVKFTERGEVVLRAQLEARDGPIAVVRFEVVDTGLGIDPHDRDRLFEPFSQADSSTTRRFGGTGLGLAICRSLVTAMGGQLGVESTPGEGSTFWFSVPLAVAPAPEAVAPPQADGLAGLSALVVDDNRTNQMILSDQLGAWGMRVDTADGAAPALASLGERARAGTPYRLCVLDMCMPDVDGLELARRITADPALQGTTLVLMSSGPDVTAAETRRAGISVSLTKPVLLSRLRRTLLEAVAGPRPVRRAPQPEPSTPSRGRLLVVDDGEINQLVATGILTRLGYAVEVADSGPAALAVLDLGPVDAVLMDVQMPGMDGYEATAEIRRREGDTRHTPVIAMTASALEGDRERCLAAGMDDYLSKPIATVAVAEVLGRWVPAR